MTKSKANLLKISIDGADMSWPKNWPRSIGMMRLGKTGPFRLFHTDESDTQIIERIAADTGKTYSGIELVEKPDAAFQKKAEACLNDPEFLEAAEDLRVNMDFVLSEGLPAHMLSATEQTSSRSAGQMSAKMTGGSEASEHSRQAGKAHVSRDPSLGWLTVAQMRKRQTIARGGIFRIEGRLCFRVEGPLGDMEPTEIDGDDIRIDEAGRRLRIPFELSAPSFYLPGNFLPVEPADQEILAAYLSSDGEFSYLNLDLWPCGLEDSADASVEPQPVELRPSEVEPAEHAAAMPAPPRRQGKHRGVTAVVVVAAALALYFAVYQSEVVNHLTSVSAIFNKGQAEHTTPGQQLKSEMFK